MSISKTVVRLSAAAIVVAGGAGMVWAATVVTGAGDPIPAAASAKVSYLIDNKAAIEVTPSGLADDALIFDVDDNNLINVNTFGNLGRIRVKTNSTAWDVVMKTDNGGRLKNSKYEEGKEVCGTNVFGEPYDCHWVSEGGAEYLTFGTTSSTAAGGGIAYTTTPGIILGIVDGSTPTSDTVLLRVAIGVAKSGKANGGGTNATLYPMLNMTGSGTVVPPIRLNNSDVLKTKKGATVANNGVGNIFDALSFAEKIGAGYSAPNVAPSGKFATSISGTASGRVWGPASASGSIAATGFPAPQGNDVADEEYFYVNVGIDPTLVNNKLIGGNKEGPYEETFYFELIAKF